MPKWDSGTDDCEKQDLIMQAGKARHARHVKHMQSRLQRARSMRGSQRQRNFSRSVCTMHCVTSWRTHCARLRERDFH
jgi:hypothetical protein